MKWFRGWNKSRTQQNDLDLESGAEGRRESPGSSIEDEGSRKRRCEAEAVLAERLRHLAQSGGARAVDETLISHAEYQLYLDECRAEGIARQPDHWSGVQFPWGEGAAPVVGVRYQDAVAFCEWLTRRDQGGRQYRVPGADEPDLGEVPRSIRLELPPGGGYWVSTAGGEGRLAQASNRECVLSGADLAAWIERDLAAGRDLYVESVLAQGRALASALDLDPDLDRTEAREQAIELVDALDRVLDRARDIDRRLAESLAEAIDGARRIDYALDGGGARDLGDVVAYAHDVDRALAVAHYRTNAVPRAHRLVRATSRAVDRGHDLVASVARAGVSDAVRILLLTGNRTSAVDRAHLLVQDLVPYLDSVRDLANDLQSAHTLSRVKELEMALMLVRACDVSRPFDLDRLTSGGLPVDLDRRGDDLAREISRVHAVLHDPDLDHVGAHALDRGQARALDRTLARDFDLVRALSRCSELARAQALACLAAGKDETEIAVDWPHVMGLLVDRSLSTWPVADRAELSRSLRLYVRSGALAAAIEIGALLQMPPDLWLDRPVEAQEPSKTWQDRLEAQRDAALDVYIQLGILEDRIEGHLPAWEAIRIVSERAD